MKKILLLFAVLFLTACTTEENKDHLNDIEKTNRDGYTIFTEINGSLLTVNNAVNSFAKNMTEVSSGSEIEEKGVIYRGTYDTEDGINKTGILAFFLPGTVERFDDDYNYENFYSDAQAVWVHEDFKDAEIMEVKSGADLLYIPEMYFSLINKEYSEYDTMELSEIENGVELLAEAAFVDLGVVDSINHEDGTIKINLSDSDGENGMDAETYIDLTIDVLRDLISDRYERSYSVSTYLNDVLFLEKQ